jgi:hypothetical protein
MEGQTALVFKKELDSLKIYALNKGFQIVELDELTFVAKNLTARDGERYSLHVTCDDYNIKPPILRWCNSDTLELENKKDIPKGQGGYFHSSGTPCAPWNRNSYKKFREAAPHAEWNIEGWQHNDKTGECLTIPRMIVKICTELKSERYRCRSA